MRDLQNSFRGQTGVSLFFIGWQKFYFTSHDTLMQALGSAEGQAAAADIPNFATGGFDFLMGKV